MHRNVGGADRLIRVVLVLGAIAVGIATEVPGMPGCSNP